MKSVPMHLAIVTGNAAAFSAGNHFLRPISELWRADGVRVTVTDDPSVPLGADASFLHVDLTVVPPPLLALARSVPVAINGATADISKRTISRNLVRRGDGWEGPVIVKTDANCGAASEAARVAASGWTARAVHALRQRLPWSFRPTLRTREYRVFDRADDVPFVVWHNPDLVVERFLPERREGRWCLRTWVFLGDRETNSLWVSDHPVVKCRERYGRQAAGAVPEDLRAMRRELGFDFGKFDYTLVDGRAVLLDANRTPTLGDFSDDDVRPRMRLLADGLRSLLPA